MILVDTSVLIDYLKGVENPPSLCLDRILTNRIPYGICQVVYLEVLQGSRNSDEFAKLRSYLNGLRIFSPDRGLESYAEAANLYMRCRCEGITVRSTIDLLIAQTAIEQGLHLLHNDSDFTNMAKAIPELKILNLSEPL